MQHRWTIASEQPDNPFPFAPDALDLLFRESRGVPRRLCKLADLALLGAFVQSQSVVAVACVEEAIRQEKGKDA